MITSGPDGEEPHKTISDSDPNFSVATARGEKVEGILEDKEKRFRSD